MVYGRFQELLTLSWIRCGIKKARTSGLFRICPMISVYCHGPYYGQQILDDLR
jgi:hypothetical protein